MEDKEFCLLDEPWIQVSMADLKQKTVSLVEVMTHAQDYIGLSGETPTQDAAIFRLLLAIALTVFYRYDEDDQEQELSEENDSEAQDVLERWKAYWDRGSFPEMAMKTYLETYRERFYLFHPQTPFYQVNGLWEKGYGTECPAKCLMGNLKESGNPATRHHFSMAEGKELEELSYGEAARWLIHLNAYGVNVKAPGNDVPGTKEPVGVGRLGQLGMVVLKEKDLFRSLMLNLCPLKGASELWGTPSPAWEREICIERGKKLEWDNPNLPCLYTMQSRRVSLKRDKGVIVGFRVMGGEYCPIEDKDAPEPMTLWKKKEVKGSPTTYLPKLHDSSVYTWEEFPALFNSVGGEGHKPGIMAWLEYLYNHKILLPKKLIQFQMVGMVYGDKMKYTYGDCISNSLDVSEGMLTDFAKQNGWIDRITEEVHSCQKVAEKAFVPFASKIDKLFKKGAKNSNLKDVLIRNYYFLIDNAFRSWLTEINPMQEVPDERIPEWRETSYRCAKQTVEEYFSAHDLKMYAYKEDGKEILTVPKALNQFFVNLRKIYPKTEWQGKERT